MLRALKYFIACLASFSFFVPHSPSRPVSQPVRPSRQHLAPVPARSTFPSVNSPAPWNAGISRQPTSVPYFPYEDCPASFPQCQT